jgi:hypothetical protein
MFEVGDGSKIRFWYDLCGIRLLRNIFRFCIVFHKRCCSRLLGDVRCFYNVLETFESAPFPKSVWRHNVPLRVTFFAWMAALGKILTMDNLKK